MRVGIFVFDQVDLLDVGGPYEVFLTASRLAARRGRTPPPFEVTTVGVAGDPVVAYGGLRLVPNGTLTGTPGLDLLIVPGAIAIEDVISAPGVLDTLRRVVPDVPVVASVCTGAFLLGELGLLEQRPWTTHWEDVERLAAKVNGEGRTRVGWVDAGQVVTSGGLSSGIAMALHLVDRFAGRELALQTARQLEYEWVPDEVTAEASGARDSPSR